MEENLNNKKFIKIVYDLENTDGIIVNCKDKEVLLIEREGSENIDVENENTSELEEKLNCNLKKAKELIDMDRKGELDKYIKESFKSERLTNDDEEFYKLWASKSIDDPQDSNNIDICKRSIEKIFRKIMAKLNGYKITKDDSEFYKLIEDYQKYNETLHCLMKKDYPKLRELWKMN